MEGSEAGSTDIAVSAGEAIADVAGKARLGGSETELIEADRADIVLPTDRAVSHSTGEGTAGSIDEVIISLATTADISCPTTGTEIDLTTQARSIGGLKIPTA